VTSCASITGLGICFYWRRLRHSPSRTAGDPATRR
jgi:hypothetical protein